VVILDADMEYFTTANQKYFDKNTRQLIASFAKHSECSVRVYSEDMQPSSGARHEVVTLRRMDRIAPFQQAFKERFQERYKFLYYFQWMDIWVLKIATQLQQLEETSSEYSIFIDSDCVVTNSQFDQTVDEFLAPFILSGKDMAFFRRLGTHLHTESGFLVLRKCPELIEAYRDMLEFILAGRFYDLASWTDCSVIDHYADTGRIRFFDFCNHYDLRSTNPVYESALRRSMLHLKGPRKGAYSIIKRVLGLYR
jgi:hypothetical protein